MAPVVATTETEERDTDQDGIPDAFEAAPTSVEPSTR
jgi:hypothetical protein